MSSNSEATKSFAKDVLEGLQQTPKTLPSKYFYNSAGDALFQKIMSLDAYYLTKAEEGIIQKEKGKILEAFKGKEHSFRLVELGAGDGSKTKVLLKHFLESGIDFIYSPIDISSNVLQQLEKSVLEEFPELNFEAIAGDYFDALSGLKKNHLQKEVVMFLGSTIGNFVLNNAEGFLKKLSTNLTKGDLLFIGFDLMKNPRKILGAYDDGEGVTSEFNFNLLKRINNELGADFNLDKFIHYPTYDPVTGETKSYLISKEAQSVNIGAAQATVHFQDWEPIHTEVSQKFSMPMIESLARETGFRVVQHFKDSKGLFVDSLWEKL